MHGASQPSPSRDFVPISTVMPPCAKTDVIRRTEPRRYSPHSSTLENELSCASGEMGKSCWSIPNVVAARLTIGYALLGTMTRDPLNTPRRMFGTEAVRRDSYTGTMPMSSKTGTSSPDFGNSAFRMKSVRITHRNLPPRAPDSNLTISSTDLSLVTDVVRSFRWSDGFRSFTLRRSIAPMLSNSWRIFLRIVSTFVKF